MEAVLSGTCIIPRAALGNPEAILRATEVKYKPLGADESVLVHGSRADEEYLYLPRQYGLELARELGLSVVDETATGYAASFVPVNPPRDYQADVLQEAVAAFDTYYDVVFRAHTGWGKTYGGLYVASQHKRTTLVIVDQDNLREQWEETACNHFGFKLEDIGLIQAENVAYEGYELVIATVQSLTQKELPPEVYDYFGFIILDEVHTIGSPTFSQVLLDFNAQMRLGVSATPKRKDALQKLLTQHMGPVRVAADKEHDANAVYFVRNLNVYSWYANTSRKLGRLLSEVADDASRNLQLCEVVQWLYETGRDVIIMSDRTEHVRHLMNLCWYMGIPQEDMGLYTGETPVFEWRKDPTPKRRPKGLWDREVEYTPVSLQSISKKIPSRTLKAVKESKRILWATYGKAAKGFDEARLCGGVDATPRSAQEQIHGRILRGGGAHPPIWVTTLDWNNPRLLKSFIARVDGFLNSNAEFYEWLEDGGLQEWQPKELLSHVRRQLKAISLLRIETGSDGRYTLLAPKESVLRTASATSKSIPRVTPSLAASSRTASAGRSTPPTSRPASSSATRLLRQRSR
jgi:hypothetical protein